MRPFQAVVAVAVLASSVTAQREEATTEWQKRVAKLAYNVVHVGRHGLAELDSGTIWRMGRNEASHLTLDMAVLVDEKVVVPGSYRVGIFRQGEKEFSFAIEGGTVGENPQGAPEPVYAKGALGKPDKPSKALEVTWKPQAKSTTPVQKADVCVTFGENRVTAPLTLVGTKSLKSGGWTFDAFSLPADVVDAHVRDGKPLPVGAFKKETGDRKRPFHVFNLLVTKEKAETWIAPVAPVQAFSGVPGMSAEGTVSTTSVKWEDAKDAKPFLEATKFEVAKGKGATIVLAAGKQTCTVSIPEPKIPE